MSINESRRSSRVVISVPIKISGIDSRGKQFSEETQTLVVNQHGAMILSNHELKPGTDVELSAFQNSAHSKARVVRIAGRNKKLGGWEVAAELSLPGNFWRINFPPQDWVETKMNVARIEEQAAGLRPRPAISTPAPAAVSAAPGPVQQAAAPSAVPAGGNGAPAPLHSAVPAGDPIAQAIRAMEAAAMGPASEALLPGMAAEDKLKRYQLVTGALLRALYRRGLLTEKELREALESVDQELALAPARTRG
jgi:hypothetical protein